MACRDISKFGSFLSCGSAVSANHCSQGVHLLHCQWISALDPARLTWFLEFHIRKAVKFWVNMYIQTIPRECIFLNLPAQVHTQWRRTSFTISNVCGDRDVVLSVEAMLAWWEWFFILEHSKLKGAVCLDDGLSISSVMTLFSPHTWYNVRGKMILPTFT